jgi:voltage-gated potassium channel
MKTSHGKSKNNVNLNYIFYGDWIIMERHYKIIFEALLTIFIIVDILFLALMVVGLPLGIKHNTVYNIGNYDLIIAILILFDFLVFRIRTDKTKDNGQFIKKNWTYIIAIIPITFICFNILHLFDYAYIIGLLVILRFYALYKVLRMTGKELRKYPSKTKLDYATVVLLLVLVIGSFLFFLVEHGANPEVPNYKAAMWYAVVSMTTVGYGDIVPITGIGRIIGMLMIFTGLGYVSLVTATLAFSFIDFFRTESRKAADRVEKRVIEYEEKIDELIMIVNDLKEKK